MSAINYCDDIIEEVKIVDVPRTGQTASGYGSKIPCRYKVRIGKIWYRVYAVCFSNAGSLYIVRNGSRPYINHDATLNTY